MAQVETSLAAVSSRGKDYVPPSGPRDADIMIVGEAPGKQEAKEGKPFVGPVGKFLRKFLLQEGIDPDRCFFTNVCRIRPPKNKLQAFFNGKMPKPVVLDGLEDLQREIEEVDPNVIVACGNYPLWALTDKAWFAKGGYWTGISRWRGSILDCTLVEGKKVVATYHPSYIRRQGMADHGTFKCDLERVKRESEFPEIRRPNKELIIDPRGSDRFWLEDKLEEDFTNFLTFDIEYIGSKLLCVGMTTSSDWAAVIVIDSPSDVDFCRKILTSGYPLAAQNGMFDCSILEWHYDMPIMQHLAYDTMLAAHAANIELPKGLDYLTSIYTDQPYHKNMVNWKAIKDGSQPVKDVYKYNAIDTWTQHKVMEEQLKHDLCDERVRKVFDFEMQLVDTLWEVSKRGIRIDLEGMEAYRDDLDKDIRIFKGMLKKINGGEDINVKSNKQVAQLLFEDLGLPTGKMNKTGPATDDKTLASLLTKTDDPRKQEVVNLIRDTRTRRDLKSKFLNVKLDDDGRMRGHYDPGGTSTGRLASRKFYPTGSGANQQNLPRDPRVRSMFVPDEGMEFGYADLRRAESFVVAHLTNDPRMLADHAPGTDAHKSLAAEIFDKPEEEITKDERYIGKRTRHAGNYMQGPRTFKRYVNADANKTGVSITYGESKHFIQMYKDLHPFLSQWWDRIEQELWKTRTLYNLLGRPRTFYQHIRSTLPTAVAYIPQSTVGDVLNVGLLNLHGKPCKHILESGRWSSYAPLANQLGNLGFEALLQVHDAVGFQYPKENRDEIVPLIRQLMRVPLESPTTLEEFEIAVDVEIGPSWGEVEEYTDDL